MSNWLTQLQSMLGQSGAGSSGSAGGIQDALRSKGLSKLITPGALGGLAGLLVASKSSRKLLAKYGGGALLVGGGAVAVPFSGISTKIKSAPRTRTSRNMGNRRRLSIAAPSG